MYHTTDKAYFLILAYDRLTLIANGFSFSAKLNDTKASGEFSNLNKGFQQDIDEVFKSIAGVVSILGNVIKCVTKDMKTIKDNLESAMNYLKKTDKTAPEKKEKNKI